MVTFHLNFDSLDYEQVKEDRIIKNINELKENALDVEDATFKFNDDRFFTDLLKKNPSNRIAFEYMMAYYLLTRQTDKIAANIHQLDDFGYEKIPRYYEEALVIYAGPKGERGILSERWKPGPNAMKRAIAFDKIESRFADQPKKAMSALLKDFGNSYYYYYMFKTSGIK